MDLQVYHADLNAHWFMSLYAYQHLVLNCLHLQLKSPPSPVWIRPQCKETWCHEYRNGDGSSITAVQRKVVTFETLSTVSIGSHALPRSGDDPVKPWPHCSEAREMLIASMHYGGRPIALFGASFFNKFPCNVFV